MAGRMVSLMEKAGFEFSLLSKFVLACQSPSLGDAAERLGQSTAALSMALHGLEERLGLKLFVRRSGRLDLLPAAFWLFRVGARLLYMEQLACAAPRNTEVLSARLVVDVDLDYAIGRVSKAVLLTSQALIHKYPELLIHWRFAGLDNEDIDDPTGLGSSDTLADTAAHVRIFYGNRNGVSDEAMLLQEDPWIVVGSPGTRVAETSDTEPLTLLRMRPEITEVMMAFAHGRNFANRLQLCDEEPAQLATLLRDAPHLRFLMPSNLLPMRLGLSRLDQALFHPQFVSTVYGQATSDGNRYARAFLDELRAQMSEERSALFDPRLSVRQVHDFNLVAHTGSISAAARVSNTAQSAVSKHITQMEEAIGSAVLRRTEEGATLSPLGEVVSALTMGIEERHDWIIRKARDIAAHAEALVTIGTLPSSGHDSALTERIAELVTRIQARYPNWQLRVVESSNTILHERVRSGELNLAVVGVVNTQVARIRLGPMEPLAVIGNADFSFGGRKELHLEDVAALPLVLGRRHLSIHQAYADAAGKRGLHLRPAVEVGSLALAIAMVRKAPLCTILPASSVRKDVEAGNLKAVPIRQDELSGALSLIFSAERELSEAERIIVQEFVRVFRPDPRAEPEVEV